MSSRSKGNHNELRAQRVLEAEGFLVQRAGYRRFFQNDFWGLFDLAAIKPEGTLLVQVKSNSKPGRKVFADIAKFAETYRQFVCEIWVHKDYVKKWRKWRFINNKFEEFE